MTEHGNGVLRDTWKIVMAAGFRRIETALRGGTLHTFIYVHMFYEIQDASRVRDILRTR